MQLHEQELKKALIQFDSLIKVLPDTKRSFLEFKRFIIFFLRIRTKSISLPTSEIMAVLKHEKPTVFYIMRKELSGSVIFNIVTHIDMSYSEAIRRLNELKQTLEK